MRTQSNRFLWISKSVYVILSTEADRAAPLETGGILLGYSVECDTVVTHAIGPGPAAVHDPQYFLPDQSYHLQEIDHLYADSGRRLRYLGDWHTHPGGNLRLSRLDQETLRRITGVSLTDLKAIRHPKVCQLFPGNLGHEQRTVQAVAELWQRLSSTADLVITGDLTAFGSTAHFSNVRDFVDAGIRRPGQRHRAGLWQDGRRIGIIPGNHDYFAGVPLPIGRTTSHFTSFFYPNGSDLPSSNWMIDLPDGRKIQFLGIDCDFDFRLSPRNRLFAWESGELHLADIVQNHGLRAGQAFVRVLLLHGSVCHRDGLFGLCELLPSAAAALRSFCSTYNVRVLLCGHTHQLNCKLQWG